MDTVQITEGPETTLVELGTSMEIAMLKDLYKRLSPLLHQPGNLVLDASQVSRVDNASLQTLVCFCRSAQHQKIAVQWRAISPALQQAAQYSGVDNFFGAQT